MLARDTATAKNAQSQQARYEDLFKRGLIPRDQYETQDANADVAAGDAGGRSGRGRDREAEPAVHAASSAPISGRTGALGVHSAIWSAPTTRRRWS